MSLPLIEALLDFFTARRVIVRGESMAPAYREGERLVVSRRAFKHRSPLRFDVVLLRPPASPASPGGMEHLKRITGLPGEKVALIDGRLYVNGAPVPEPHLADEPDPPPDDIEWSPGPREYVVLGDNRRASTDSRSYGVVPRSRITGPVVRRA